MNWCSENKSLNETYERERRERSIDDLEYWHKVHDRVLENTGDPARAVRVADKRTYGLDDKAYFEAWYGKGHHY